MRVWQIIVIGVLVVIIGLSGMVFYQVHNLRVEQVTEDLHVIYGMGGNVGVLRTDEGTVIIDTMTLHYQGEGIRELAESLTGNPVTMIINTHYHLDHTHGNPAFEPGTRVVATERTLHHLLHQDKEYFSGEAAQFMPNETFAGRRQIQIGGKTLDLVHPGAGHTDGDLVVLMKEEDTIHTGDLFFNGHYPNIDLEAGGSVQAWGNTIDQVLEFEFTKVIPGHGPVTDRAGFKQFQQFMRQLADIGRQAKDDGLTLAQTIASDLLTEDQGYEELRIVIPIGLSREFVLQRSWEETHNAFELQP